MAYNLLVPAYTNCPSGWLLVFTRRQDSLYDFSRKTSNRANTFAQLSVQSLGEGWLFKKKKPSYCAGLWSPLEVKSLSSAEAPTEYSNKNNRPVIIYRLGGGRGGDDFRGDHLIFGRTKGGSVSTEKPKGGIAENFERIRRGDHSNLLGK